VNRAACIARALGWTALGLLMLATGTVRADSSEPTEYLDEETAATITVVAQPLVFAYAHRELAANARDYATVAAAAVNEAGKIHFVLIVYFWSTVDPRLRTDAPPAAEPLVLQADDRGIGLSLRGHSAHEAGIGIPVHAPPGNPVVPNVYGIDLPTLRYLVAAHRLTLSTDSDGTPQAYELWEDRRAALRAFVQRMGGG
jgi:hypothetical protein